MSRLFIQIELILLLAIMLPSCKGRYYDVPSGSMANTIMVRDRIYVTSASSFDRNDIVMYSIFADDYNDPIDLEQGKFNKTWQKWISRVIAVSGDAIRIDKGDVYINDRMQPLPPDALGQYYVRAIVPIDDFPEEQEEYDLPVLIQKNGDTLLYRVPLTARQAEDYNRRRPAIVEVKKIVEETKGSVITPLATNCGACPWTVDNYGPVRIPSPGETVVVDTNNFLLYQHIPGIAMGPNVIKEKLYFLLGDNRHGAMDSRYNGFISHSKMHGIVK